MRVKRVKQWESVLLLLLLLDGRREGKETRMIMSVREESRQKTKGQRDKGGLLTTPKAESWTDNNAIWIKLERETKVSPTGKLRKVNKDGHGPTPAQNEFRNSKYLQRKVRGITVHTDTSIANHAS